MSPDIQSWHEFVSVSAGIAATLSGLVFLAVSINLMQVINSPGVVTLALESLTQLLGAMIIALIALVPGQRLSILGVEVSLLTCVLWATQTKWQIVFFRHHRKGKWRWAANRFLRTQLSCSPFFIAGLLLCNKHPDAMYWYVPGMLLSFVAGVTNAWVLLVTIVRVRDSITPATTAHVR